MEHGGSLLRSQETATGPYPEPDEFTPHFRALLLPETFIRYKYRKLSHPSGFPTAL